MPSEFDMYTFELSSSFLTKNEQEIFNDFLRHEKLDEGIWGVFSCLFRSSTKHTLPMMLRVFEGPDLCGAAILIKCKKYGRALFHNKMLARFMDMTRVPFLLWVRFGCCMDMMSNSGFARDPAKLDEICRAIAGFLKKNSILTVIYDYTEHVDLFPEAYTLPSLPHALIDTSQMTDLQDYAGIHKNINHKLKKFRRKGGKIERVYDLLSDEDINSLHDCFVATSESSVFYLPYQDLYLKSALNTSKTELQNVVFFVARSNGDFLGYQAAIKTGKYLNALHGAFDRRCNTTYHAYDLMFVEMTAYAIEYNLESVDFGAVLNATKQRMVNRIIDMSYFLLSKYRVIQYLFRFLLKQTRIQGNEQLQFRGKSI